MGTDTLHLLRAKVAGVLGAEQVSAWLERIPALVTSLEDAWSIRVGEPFPGLTYHWVAPCRTADGGDAVLKLGFGDATADEATALAAFGGRGVVRLLQHDPQRDALLVERAIPGVSLTSIADEQAATTAITGVIAKLPHDVPAGVIFPTVAKWAESFAEHRAAHGGGAGPIPERLFARAEETYRAFLAAPTGRVLLHGDLHHDNVLSHGDGWIAIDPKGVIGEPEYEAGAYLGNPPAIFGEHGATARLRERAHQLSDELGFDRQRVLAWAGAQLVLAATWDIQDRQADPLRWLSLADAFELN